MPADMEEFNAAISDGVEFYELLSPIEWSAGKLKCQKMELGEPDASGRRRPIPVEGSEFELACDLCIVAVGSDAQVGALAGPSTKQLDLKGQAVIPGIFLSDDKMHAEVGETMKAGKTVGGHYASLDLGLPFHGYVAGGPADDHEGTRMEDAVARVRQVEIGYRGQELVVAALDERGLEVAAVLADLVAHELAGEVVREQDGRFALAHVGGSGR